MASDLLLYSGIVLAGLSLFWFVSALLGKNKDAAALSWAAESSPLKSKSKLIESCRPLVHQFTLKHAMRIRNERLRKRLEALIRTSGMERELNVDEFLGLQLLLGVLTPVVLIILNFALQLGYPTWLMILLAPLGFFIPIVHANSEKKKRTTAVLADLPFFIDLLALSTEAGLDFLGAIQRIVDKAEGSVLAEELGHVIRDIKLGSTRYKALKDMAERLDIPEVISFVNVLTDADATGASIADVLKEQSEQMRLERFVRAEKAGARASQAILIPLIIFILPAVFIMVFAPVALQFFYGGGK